MRDFAAEKVKVREGKVMGLRGNDLYAWVEAELYGTPEEEPEPAPAPKKAKKKKKKAKKKAKKSTK